MTTRKIRPVFDDLTSQNSFRLNVSLADFLPNTQQVDAAQQYISGIANKQLQGSPHTSGTEQATTYANSSPSAILRTRKTSF